jgi:hypothetical protein
MRRDVLGAALHEVPIPKPADAEERGRRIVEAAYAERAGRERGGPENRRSSLPRFALVLAISALLAALLLSPAGAAVRDWVGEVVRTSAPRPEPTLGQIPGGGSLLVQSAAGPWVVKPDGSRRLLGEYDEATWSPRGLFVAATRARTLSALEPDGTPRWSLDAPRRVGDPRWSPTGERIAYRVGSGLWVVAGDGTGAGKLAMATAPVAPAWSPLGVDQLAYVTAGGGLRIADSESGKALASAPALPDIGEMEWAAGGRAILEASSRALRLRPVRMRKLPPQPLLGSDRELSVAPGSTVIDAALAPHRQVVAAVITRWRAAGTRSSIVVFGRDGRPQRLLTVPGSLGEISWSPDGRHLLVTWPYANQWLFLPVGRGQGRAVANISAAFSPGRAAASFPRLEGWCCLR